MKPRVVEFRNDLASGSYELVAKPGDFTGYEQFDPFYTPKEMLQRGVFGGRYLNSCQGEYPADWFEVVRLSYDRPRAELNYYGVLSGLPLKYWQDKGWIVGDDVRGWFEWYCRFYMGRRCDDDARQIGRWAKFSQRHKATSPVRQQALLQWAHDPS